MTQSVKTGVVLDTWGHSGSLEIAPSDRAHEFQLAFSIEIKRDIARKSPILTYRTCIWRFRWGGLYCKFGISPRSLAMDKLSTGVP